MLTEKYTEILGCRSIQQLRSTYPRIAPCWDKHLSKIPFSCSAKQSGRATEEKHGQREKSHISEYLFHFRYKSYLISYYLPSGADRAISSVEFLYDSRSSSFPTGIHRTLRSPLKSFKFSPSSIRGQKHVHIL